MLNKQLAINLFPPGGYKGLGTGVLATPGANGPTLFAKIISSAIGILTVVAIIWFIFIFITGAIGIMSSGGDKQALETAKKKITTGITGLVVVIIAVFVFDLIGFLLGFGTGGLLNIGNLINLIQIK